MEKAARGDVKKVEVKGGTYPSIDNFCFWNPLKWKNNLLVPKLKTSISRKKSVCCTKRQLKLIYEKT